MQALLLACVAFLFIVLMFASLLHWFHFRRKGFVCAKHTLNMEPRSLSVYRHIPNGSVWLVARAAKEFMLLERQRENKAQRQRQKQAQADLAEDEEDKPQLHQHHQQQADQPHAGSLVGRRVRIWWEDDEQYYEADVQEELPMEQVAGGSGSSVRGGEAGKVATHRVCYVADNLQAEEDLSTTEGLIVPWQMLASKEEAEAVAKTKWAMSQAPLVQAITAAPSPPQQVPPGARKRKLQGGGLAAEFLEGNKWHKFVDDAPCVVCGSSENEANILQCGDGKRVSGPTF
jgi:hypothetical protein